jgi:predicted ATPase/class 3 adenylate cyclase
MAERPSGTVTFLFTDIEGSTRRWDRDRATMAVALARHDALLRTAIAANGGHVFKTVGDAFCAAFASAGRALEAAVAGQRALNAEAWGAIGALRVRMALHTGDAEERDADYFGPAVNRVARLLATGYGGQILLSRAVADGVRDRLPEGADLLDLGGHRLKDLARPEHVFQFVVPDLPRDFPPIKSLENRPTNLPVQPTPLVGREREVDQAAVLLRSDVRLLTLVGPGGSGKTRLGAQAAAELVDDFPDGVWFVDLSALRQPELVVAEVARTLGVRQEGLQPMRDRLIEALRDEQALLLLDNFEQVVEAADGVAALLAGCPKLRVMVTSRSPLRIRDERTFPVLPLAVPDATRLPSVEALAEVAAVRLFVERATGANPAFALTAENAAAVAAICRRLEGLPLAIELAAARSRLLSPAALHDRLERRLGTLARGSRDLPVRQQTMRDAIAWSHELLTPDEQMLFRRLAVFAGGWTLEAAEWLTSRSDPAGTEALDVLAGLEELADQSLIRSVEQSDGEVRLGMLETIREFGLEQLAALSEAETVQRVHADYFQGIAERAGPLLLGPEQRTWLATLEREHDNLQAALGWSLGGAAPETGLRLAGSLARFWHIRGYFAIGRAWLERALAGATESPRSERVRALTGAGTLAYAQGDLQRAAMHYEQGLAMARAIGDERATSFLLHNLGVAASARGDRDRARALYEESLALKQALGDKAGAAMSLGNLGTLAHFDGDLERAASLHEESLALFREMDDWRGEAGALNSLGVLAHARGDLAAATAHFEQCLGVLRALNDKGYLGRTLTNLGRLARDQGNLVLAATRYREGLAVAHEIGDQAAIADGLEGIGAVAATRQPARGARLLGAAESLREALSAPMTADHREAFLRDRVAVREHLAEPDFAIAWAAGRSFSLDEAVDEALALGDELSGGDADSGAG